MIKFFRHIRQSLINQGKIGKYLTYAIGEIILVVIGILIALQVSNWNEKRRNKISEHIILQDLNTELKNNITALEAIIEEHQKSFDATMTIEELIKDSIKINEISYDSILPLLTTMNHNWTYDPKLGILNSTINSGKIDLIQNKEIRYLLSSIQESIFDANESTDEIGKIRGEFYWPLMASHYEAAYDVKSNFKPQNMLHDPKFMWWTKFIKAVRNESLEEEGELLSFLKDIHNKIAIELENQ